MIYFIQEDEGPIKIGISHSPEARLTDLQVGNPRPLRLLGVIRKSDLSERQMHDRFKDSRLIGEWFTPTADLLRYIRRHAVHPLVRRREQNAALVRALNPAGAYDPAKQDKVQSDVGPSPV